MGTPSLSAVIAVRVFLGAVWLLVGIVALAQFQRAASRRQKRRREAAAVVKQGKNARAAALRRRQGARNAAARAARASALVTRARTRLFRAATSWRPLAAIAAGLGAGVAVAATSGQPGSGQQGLVGWLALAGAVFAAASLAARLARWDSNTLARALNARGGAGRLLLLDHVEAAAAAHTRAPPSHADAGVPVLLYETLAPQAREAGDMDAVKDAVERERSNAKKKGHQTGKKPKRKKNKRKNKR